MKIISIIILVFLAGCEQISPPKPLSKEVKISGWAVLGPISKGKITIVSMSDNKTLHAKNIYTEELTYNMVSSKSKKLLKSSKVGQFSGVLKLPANLADDDLIKISVTGGIDIDPNDDFIIEPQKFIKLEGEASVITTLLELKTGKVVINAISSMAVQKAHGFLSRKKIIKSLDETARLFLSNNIKDNLIVGDINNDGKLNFKDIARFNPKSQSSEEMSNLAYLRYPSLYLDLINGEDSLVQSILSADNSKFSTYTNNYLDDLLAAKKLKENETDVTGNNQLLKGIVPENMLITSADIHKKILSVYDESLNLDISSDVFSDAINIPISFEITSGNVALLKAFTTEITISDSSKSDQGEKGVKLIFSWDSASFTESGIFYAKISLDDSQSNIPDGEYHFMKKNTTTPDQQIAEFTFPINSLGSSSVLKLSVTAGVLDSKFSKGFRYLYFPVMSPVTKRWWLNHNLGATYSNVDSDSFDPLHKAISTDDLNASGELMDLTSVNCPIGYSLPSKEEWKAEYQNWDGYKHSAFSSFLGLTAGGYKNTAKDKPSNYGKSGYYWTSDSIDDNETYNFYFSDKAIRHYKRENSSKYSVRCIKHNQN